MKDKVWTKSAAISDDPLVRLRYVELRYSGQSHNMAEMLATRSFPGVKGTDRAFMQGRALDGSQFDNVPPIVGRGHVKKALSAGVNPTGKYYCGPLAAYPGDPKAWVDSLGDVRRIAAERKLDVQGAVNIAAPPPDAPPAPYRVADDIVDKQVDAAIAHAPELSRVRPQLRAEVAERLKGDW